MSRRGNDPDRRGPTVAYSKSEKKVESAVTRAVKKATSGEAEGSHVAA